MDHDDGNELKGVFAADVEKLLQIDCVHVVELLPIVAKNATNMITNVVVINKTVSNSKRNWKIRLLVTSDFLCESYLIWKPNGFRRFPLKT